MMVRLTRGVATIVFGTLVASACVTSGTAQCIPAFEPGVSVARVWNETLLDAIRRDFPAPTVHARNLFHVSAAMWDAWAAYDPGASGYFVDEDLAADDVALAREEAMSYAAYRILRHRYATAAGVGETMADFDRVMDELCYSTEVVATDGDSPAALGNRIAAAAIAFGRTDGANERDGYLGDYTASNPPLIIAEAGADMTDPNRWQPLAFEEAIAQNGLPLAAGVQQYVGPHWGYVTPFALPPDPDGVPIDPGSPPYLGDPSTDAAFKEAVVEVIRASSTLDPADPTTQEIGPAGTGNNPLGTNDGAGHARNPVTDRPYTSHEVQRADFGRIIAEFWADGPHSETPPGHWNTLANTVSDDPALDHRIGGTEEVDRLEWDVKLYFALNGAMHDAAIAAWGAKAHYDYVRPISMIRHMGGLGQSTDPEAPAYHPSGLPLVPGLIELITDETSAPGAPHADLKDHVGEVAIYAWTGPPEDEENAVGGVDWIRAVEWLPYQRDTFVTPAFAAYVSGHSAFSRAGAEVLTAVTGSEFFPGGLGEWTIPAGGLEFEAGPATDVSLQWATYQDAADQAGLSRIYGGIHVSADDFAGRRMGAECGRAAWALAVRYWEGLASPVQP